MKLRQINKDTHFSREELGGKGYNLQKLIGWGFKVPETYVILAAEVDSLHLPSNQKYRLPNHGKTPNLLLAVRSSGIGEDGENNSFAGIFSTLLHVKPENLDKAVREVHSSMNTSVTSMYNTARNAEVSGMAIIVQEMIEPDFAGVAFSVSPIENDPKVGLIEIVKGVGERLVSGKVKPTSLRINRVTTMYRILQDGTDQISLKKLEQIIAKVSKELWLVADYYQEPIDIEWAIKSDTLYLLQARPITTLESQL